MMEFALSLAQFALQAVVIVICLVVLIAFIASLISKGKQDSDLKITHLNKKFNKNRRHLLKNRLEKKDFKKVYKEEKALEKNQRQENCAFVLRFDGDIKASATEQLREEITTIIGVAKKTDQVVLVIESPGGMVHGYGLAASQLQRIKDAGLPLTVCVDKIAASGGYMMACLADKIVAAPFAIIGSIGVVASVPNFNKVLKKNDVDYLEITAGEYKRTITPLGEITEPGMKKFKEQIEGIHTLFKDHVIAHRPQLDLEKVATGEYWYGHQAKELKLIDELGTSDECLTKLYSDHKVLEVKLEGKKSFKEKLSENMSFQLETVYTKVANLLWKSRFQ